MLQQDQCASSSGRTTAQVCVCAEYHVDGLVQEKRNSSALAMGLYLSYTNPSKYAQFYWVLF